MADNNKKGILYLFDRPTEPVYVPKGENKVAFDIPADYLPDRYKSVAVQVFNRFNDDTESKISVQQIGLPDLSIFDQLGRRDAFSLFIPKHRKLATRLIDIFMGMRTYEDFLSVSVYCRDRLNSHMFIYALSVAILHRPDTKNLPLPPLSEIFPDKYMDGQILSRAKEEANLIPAGSRVPIEIPRDYTATDLDEEHRVAYWREDVGVNLHHWHWHLVYPFEGDMRIVNKDRRGELFYYMHQQINSRYNIERLCNNLGRVKRLNNLREPIPEAYFPKLDSMVSSRSWPSRPSGAVLKDINRPVDDLRFDLQDMERWRDRIYEAIHTGSVINSQGQRVQLTEKDGIDILGNLMEASTLSLNPNVYGDLHNLGHVVLSYCHDPDHRYLENFSPIGEPATAMRDPIFYRWHAFTGDVFLEHKNTLPEYNLQQNVVDACPDICGTSEASAAGQGQASNTSEKTNGISPFMHKLTQQYENVVDACPDICGTSEASAAGQGQASNTSEKTNGISPFMHKLTQQYELVFNGIRITGIQAVTPNAPANVLKTFWSQSDVDLSRGLDFTPRGPVLARFTHLNHTEYKYRIAVNNSTGSPQMGTVRLFIAPKFDERGLPFSFRAQKDLMVEMDKFTVTLRPGDNTIERRSTESSVTIPFERTFRSVDEGRPIGGDALELFNFCGCGWPQHLLVPKGTKEGYVMDLFVMISDYKDDRVQQDEPAGCSDAASFCGLRDRKYPDARSMGYPFDRRPRAGVETLRQFLTPNMAFTEIKVRFEDVVRPRTG